jgi:hypothetical protein
MKRIFRIGVALIVALGAGWAWGAWGRLAIARTLQIAELRDGLLEGRAAVLDARLDIYSINFGEASRHFEVARRALRAADTRLAGLNRDEDRKQIAIALQQIDEAQRLAGQLSQDANARAADAAKTIDGVIERTLTGEGAAAAGRVAP